MYAPKICWSYVDLYILCFLLEKSAQFKITIKYLDCLVKLVLSEYSSMQIFSFLFQNLHSMPTSSMLQFRFLYHFTFLEQGLHPITIPAGFVLLLSDFMSISYASFFS